jgi:hypothetical protein
MVVWGSDPNISQCAAKIGELLEPPICHTFCIEPTNDVNQRPIKFFSIFLLAGLLRTGISLPPFGIWSISMQTLVLQGL